jgi:hypothetical protein
MEREHSIYSTTILLEGSVVLNPFLQISCIIIHYSSNSNKQLGLQTSKHCHKVDRPRVGCNSIIISVESHMFTVIGLTAMLHRLIPRFFCFGFTSDQKIITISFQCLLPVDKLEKGPWGSLIRHLLRMPY